MDFAAVSAELFRFLSTNGYRSAIVGGVGLAAYGLARTTLDLDLVTELAAQAPLVAHLEAGGWETLHRSRGYSNHLHPDPAKGRVDFVYVDGETAAKLFRACRRMRGPGGGEIAVASPEHLAAMKALAIRNDPSRLYQDLADVRFLIGLPDVDLAAVRESFAKHGLGKEIDALVASL